MEINGSLALSPEVLERILGNLSLFLRTNDEAVLARARRLIEALLQRRASAELSGEGIWFAGQIFPSTDVDVQETAFGLMVGYFLPMFVGAFGSANSLAKKSAVARRLVTRLLSQNLSTTVSIRRVCNAAHAGVMNLSRPEVFEALCGARQPLRELRAVLASERHCIRSSPQFKPIVYQQFLDQIAAFADVIDIMVQHFAAPQDT